MKRNLLALLCLLLAITTFAAAAGPAPVTIMTQNLDAGTDLTYVILGALGGNIPAGVALTYQEILASAIPQRADLLAAQVAEKKPDILALQEATLWRTGETPDTATTVVADQLQLLLSGLATRNVPYDIVAVDTVTDVALPMSPSAALRMTDRDVLLVRADLRPPAFHFSDVHANIFDAVYSFDQQLQVPAGWISAMIHLGNRHFRLFTTHLQSSVPGDPTAAETQEAQAKQLLYEARNSTVPVVIAGDFNSDAILGTGGPGPDNTGTVGLILSAGYTDAWSAVNSDTGATWPFYAEDHYPPPPFVMPATPYERIDLIFSQGLNAVQVERVIAPGPTVWPSFASDHAGVLAKFEF